MRIGFAGWRWRSAYRLGVFGSRCICAALVGRARGDCAGNRGPSIVPKLLPNVRVVQFHYQVSERGLRSLILIHSRRLQAVAAAARSNVHEWLPQTIPAMKPCLAAAEDRQVSRDTHQILCGEHRLGDHDRLHGLLGERDRTTAFQENRKKRTRLDLFWRHAILERPFHSASAIG